MDGDKHILYVKEFMKHVALKSSLFNYTLEIIPLSVKGENYLGKIFFVTLKSADGKRLDVVVKMSLTDADVRSRFHIKEIFDNEIYFYNVILREFSIFQNDLSVSGICNIFPKCYHTYCCEEYEILALENLKVKGYETIDRRKTLTRSEMELTFKTYARFHAISFAMKSQKPEAFSKLLKPLKSAMEYFTKDESIINMTRTIFTAMEKSVEKLGCHDLMKKFSKYKENAVDVLREAMVFDKQYSVIAHGDGWSNNLMFKYRNRERRQPSDLAIIDWQLTDYSSPVRDLLYSFFTSGSKELFDDTESFLNLYHQELSNSIRKLGSDSEKLYPYARLKEDWKKHAAYGLIMGTILNKMKLTYEDSIVDVVDHAKGIDLKNFMETGYDKETFEKRFLDIINYMYNIGAL